MKLLQSHPWAKPTLDEPVHVMLSNQHKLNFTSLMASSSLGNQRLKQYLVTTAICVLFVLWKGIRADKAKMKRRKMEMLNIM